MGENTFSSVTRRVDRNNQDNKYRTLVEQLIKLESNEWPKFQEYMKKLHSFEFQKAHTSPTPLKNINLLQNWF